MPRLVLIGLAAGLFSALRRGETPGSPPSPLLFAAAHDGLRGCAGPSPAPPATGRLIFERRT
jgi:hypothetical protein